MVQTMRAKAPKKVERGDKVVEKCHGFSIREVRPGYYFVQARRAGLKVAQGFASVEAARFQCTEWATTLLNEGLDAFKITQAQRRDATKALAFLGDRASLVSAAQAWLKLNPPADAMTVAQLFDMHIADISGRNRRKKTVEARRQFLNRFTKDYGTRAASSITTDDVEQWLKLRVPEKTFNTMRFCLGAAYAFAIRQRLTDSNPVAAILPKQFDRAEPHFWTAAATEAVMRAAVSRDAKAAAQQAKMKKPGEKWLPLVPYFALSAFGGLRPEEAARLDWSNVNLDEKLIRVPAAVSKVRRARLVPMRKNFVAWLLPYRQSAGPIAPTPTTIRRARKSILETAKLPAKWPQDVLRHSFATHWMAAFSHEGQLAEMMGNSPVIIQRHYKGLTTKKEGKKYFEILPTHADEVVQFKAA